MVFYQLDAVDWLKNKVEKLVTAQCGKKQAVTTLPIAVCHDRVQRSTNVVALVVC